MSSILFTRFILNLRTLDNGTIDPDRSLHYSSINFATSFVGNIGEPLGNSSRGDISDVGTPLRQNIENPLSVGILDIQPSINTRYVKIAFVPYDTDDVATYHRDRLTSRAISERGPGIAELEEQRME